MRSSLVALLAAFGQADDSQIKIKVGGLDRNAFFHFPSSHKGGKVPLVVDLHALACNPEEEALMTDFKTLGDKEGFAVVYPEGYDIGQPLSIPDLGPLPWGVPGGKSWNAGACCGDASVKKPPRQDVQFIRDLIAHLRQEFEIDETRIYATGMSNGGFMTNRLACEARELFAAVAPVSGVIANQTSTYFGGGEAYPCPDHNPPLPVITFHGTWDPLVPWDGNPLFGFPSITEHVDRLMRLNGLDPKEDKGTVSYKHKSVECTSHGTVESNVTLCKIGEGGHSWPGAHNPLFCELQQLTPGIFCNMNIDATAQIWEFFKRYSLQKQDVLV